MRPCLALAALLLASSCGDNRAPPPPPPTPEQIAATAVDGTAVTVAGTVHALTFDNAPDPQTNYPLKPDRFLLIWSEVPAGVTIGPGFEGGAIKEGWGLGVRILAADLAIRPLPQVGDRVEVRGTFRHVAWAGQMMPVIEDAQIEQLTRPLLLGGLGATCHHDLDCHDRLVCDRATTKCAPPAEQVIWGEDWRNLHGTCVTDDDCPLPLVCDARYTTTLTGPYTPPYFLSRDGGKHLCVPRDGATVADLCPRTVATEDLIGGRFVTGKLICLEGDVWLETQPEDGDTHLQMKVDQPLPYPASDAVYSLVGAPSEISPPYKDPSRPQGAVLDPAMGSHIVSTGVVRYDDDHGWFEVHSVTTYTTLSPGPGARAFMARYPTDPGSAIDWDEIEGDHREADHARALERARALGRREP